MKVNDCEENISIKKKKKRFKIFEFVILEKKK